MLVLSRRVGEKICFSNIGVTIEVVRLQGSIAKIGIDAPPSIRILREEIAERPAAGQHGAVLTPHELNNRLNRLTLAMHLFQKQRDAGMSSEADATLANLFAGLESIDKDWADARQLDSTKRAPSRCRTLLVEDDANERELLSGLLNMNGCECATAVDGDEALEYLRVHERPDVVLLDVHMPRCDGPRTLRAIRGEPRLADLRVFCVSGTAPQDMGIVTGPGGIDGWFPKPLNPRNLLDAVKKCAYTTPSIN